jgi:hypothetical protein
MAAVAVPPSPQVSAMSNRRVPLANLQNATNSPLRATAMGGKRQRSHASEQRDVAYGQPPSKKQAIEVDDAEARRHGLVRRSGAPATALTRKLEAARDSKLPPKQLERVQQRAIQDLETIRQWQRHYRKLFPAFVFYFDSVSNLQKDKIMGRAQMLGSVGCPAPFPFLLILTIPSVRLPSSPKMLPTSSPREQFLPTTTPVLPRTPGALSTLTSPTQSDLDSRLPSRNLVVVAVMFFSRPGSWE